MALRTEDVQLRWADVQDLLSGIMLRAMGVPLDLRLEGADGYHELDVPVAVGQDGSAYTRLMLRLQEMHLSTGLTTLMLSNVALGSVHDALVMPDTEEMKLGLATLHCILHTASRSRVGKLGVSEGRVPAGSVQRGHPYSACTWRIWWNFVDLVLGEIDR